MKVAEEVEVPILQHRYCNIYILIYKFIYYYSMKNIMVSMDEEMIDELKKTGNASHTIREAVKNHLEEKRNIETKEIPEELRAKMPDIQDLLLDQNKRNSYFENENSEENKAFRLTLTYTELLALERRHMQDIYPHREDSYVIARDTGE